MSKKICKQCGKTHYRSGESLRWCPDTYADLSLPKEGNATQKKICKDDLDEDTGEGV